MSALTDAIGTVITVKSGRFYVRYGAWAGAWIQLRHVPGTDTFKEYGPVGRSINTATATVAEFTVTPHGAQFSKLWIKA